MSNQGAYAIIATVRAFELISSGGTSPGASACESLRSANSFCKNDIGKYISKLIATKARGKGVVTYGGSDKKIPMHLTAITDYADDRAARVGYNHRDQRWVSRSNLALHGANLR